jgi:bifunctional DNA-binding transcriptional regulator/antitoxin component of YhaV-PrlF toxin-antitoxin module
MQKVPMTHGRIVIPAALRRKYGLADGEVVLDDRGPDLRVLSVQEAIHRIQEIAAPYLKDSPSLADELSADRRVEAFRESGDR